MSDQHQRPPRLSILGIELSERDDARLREIGNATGKAARSIIGAKDDVADLMRVLGRSSTGAPSAWADRRRKKRAR